MTLVVGTIQIRRGTSAEWAATNPVLALGEWGLDTTLAKVKIGNGTSTWSALLFAPVEAPVDGIQYARADANWAPVVTTSYGTTQGYTYTTSGTTPPPSNGNFRMNSATQSAVTLIYLSVLNEDNVNLLTYLMQRVKVGDTLYIQSRVDTTKWQLYTVNGAIVDNTTYVTIPVVWVAGGSALTNQRCVISRESVGSVPAFGEAPNDGKNYGRKSLAWTPVFTQLTQAAYDALSPPDANTLYVIVG